MTVFTGENRHGEYTVINIRPGPEPEPLYIVSTTPLFQLSEEQVILNTRTGGPHFRYGNRETGGRRQP